MIHTFQVYLNYPLLSTSPSIFFLSWGPVHHPKTDYSH